MTEGELLALPVVPKAKPGSWTGHPGDVVQIGSLSIVAAVHPDPTRRRHNA
jgi:hypothetical protein